MQILKMVYLPSEIDMWIAEKFRVGGVKVRLSESVCSILISPFASRKKRRECQQNGKLLQSLMAIQSALLLFDLTELV